MLLHALESEVDVLEDLLNGGVVLDASDAVTEFNVRNRAKRMSNVAGNPIREELVELLTKIVAGVLNVVQNLFDSRGGEVTTEGREATDDLGRRRGRIYSRCPGTRC